MFLLALTTNTLSSFIAPSSLADVSQNARARNANAPKRGFRSPKVQSWRETRIPIAQGQKPRTLSLPHSLRLEEKELTAKQLEEEKKKISDSALRLREEMQVGASDSIALHAHAKHGHIWTHTKLVLPLLYHNTH